MTSGTVATFEESLERLEVGWTHTDADGFAETLRTVCADPAVGTPLPWDDVTLPDWVDADPTADDVRTAATGVSHAGIGIADYGSVVLPATTDGTEPVSLYPETHVPVLRRSDLVDGMPEAFSWLAETVTAEGGSAIVATGPSATADMGALVKGAHGPKAVHVVVLDDRADDAGDGRRGTRP
jgi:L-lactate dehydrogenase complex protein LldG